MIVNLKHFLDRRRPLWDEYDRLLTRLEDNHSLKLDLQSIQRLRHLHETVAGDLVRVRTFASEPETVEYLESLLARGFGFIHESRTFRPSAAGIKTGLTSFPRALRKHQRLFVLVTATFLFGMLMGGILVRAAPEAKDVLLPFGHLHGDPSERVAEEEAAAIEGGDMEQSTFAAYLMVNNIRVSILALVMGVLAGVFTLVIVFYNGVILGAVCVDYLFAGEGVFLAGWLLPHGSVEIPAILFSATAGLLIGKAVLLREDRQSLLSRMQGIRQDVLRLLGGVVALLIWAGLIESFFSQFHAPALPYSVKITFGVIQSILLVLYLRIAGRTSGEPSS
jgi:uncharacterized membrane protein SpoIIM required for sporulation